MALKFTLSVNLNCKHSSFKLLTPGTLDPLSHFVHILCLGWHLEFPAINYFSIPPNFPFQLKLCWVVSNNWGGKFPDPCSRPSPRGESPPPQKCSQEGEAARTLHPSGGTRAVPALSLVPLTQFPLRSGLSSISVHQADVTDAGKAVLRPHSLPPSAPCHMASIHARPRRVCSLTTDTN